jgi:hypothetical protein
MFGADLRSLAALRIALALIVLIDIAGRWADLRVHYTDGGVLPREAVMDSLNPWRWSLGFLNGTSGFQQGLFLVTALAAIGMLLGYRTRLMTVLVWILILSIQIRNPLVLSAADLLLRLLLFWGMFLPLGAVWSIDRRRMVPLSHRSTAFLSVASLGLFLQIAFMYWFTAALKTGAEWRENGTALYYALSAEHLTTNFGEWAQQFPSVLKILTFASFGIEIVAPIVLFSPIWNSRCRMVAILALVGMHIGILLTMNIGIFPWTSALCMVAFLPASFWDQAAPRARIALQPLTAWLRQLPIQIQIRPVADGAARAVRPWAALEDGLRLTQSPVLMQSTVDSVSSPAQPGNQRVGTASSSEGTWQQPALRSSWLNNLAAACCLLIVFGWNMTTVTAFSMPSQSRPIVYTLGIEQKWNMFAPAPPRATIWYVMVGTLRNGEQVEMLTPIVRNDMTQVVPFSWERPDDIASDYYQDKYWRKYFDAIAPKVNAGKRNAFASYVCKTWNAYYADGMQVQSLVYVIVSEKTSPDGEPVEAQQGRGVLGRFTCV